MADAWDARNIKPMLSQGDYRPFWLVRAGYSESCTGSWLAALPGKLPAGDAVVGGRSNQVSSEGEATTAEQ